MVAEQVNEVVHAVVWNQGPWGAGIVLQGLVCIGGKRSMCGHIHHLLHTPLYKLAPRHLPHLSTTQHNLPHLSTTQPFTPLSATNWYSPTILSPERVLHLTTCMARDAAAKASPPGPCNSSSSCVQRLSTAPHSTWYVTVRKPVEHCVPRSRREQLP